MFALYDEFMAMTKQQLVAEALTLKPRDREEIADELWRSLDKSKRERVAESWASEIARRLDEIHRGEATLIDGAQVMREARKLVRKHRR